MHGSGRDDGGDQAGIYLVDVARDCDRRRQDGAGAQQFDIRADGLLGVDDGFRGERGVVTADEVGEAAAEILLGEEVGAALGVVDDGDLEPGAAGVTRLDR